MPIAHALPRTARLRHLFGAGVCLALAAAPAHATFTLIDDFDAHTPGDVAGQGSWSADADTIFEVGTDPSDAGNQVLSVLDNPGLETLDAYNDDPALGVAEGSTATLFYRFRFGDSGGVGGPHVNLGLSDVAAPGGTWDDFEAQLRTLLGGLDARDGADFEELSMLSADEWYKLWMVIDQDRDVSAVYVQSDTQFPSQTQLVSAADAVEFRNGTTDPLVSFFLRNCSATECGDAHVGPWQIDDLHVDAGGANLANPLVASGSFVLVDDFESHVPGDVAGQGSWSASAGPTFDVAADLTDAANQVLNVADNPGTAVEDAYNADPSLAIAEGTTGTVFFRLYVDGPMPHVNFGISDVAAPGGDFAHFEAQLRSLSGNLDARDGAVFEGLSPLWEGEWFLVWMVVDNAADTTDVYVASESGSQFPAQTQLTGGFDPIDFRNGTFDPLSTFFLRSSGSEVADPHVGPWYLDDLYLDADGENLADPLPAPGGGLALGACAALLAVLGRRRASRAER